MLPGFALLGLLAVGFQLLVIAVVAAVVRYRYPTPSGGTASRSRIAVALGTLLAAGGQTVAIVAIGSLRTQPWPSLDSALTIQTWSLAVAVAGYLVLVTGAIGYLRTVPDA